MAGGPVQLHSALLDVVQELLCVLDEDGEITWAGPGWGRELGLDPEALRGRPLAEVVCPQDRGRLAIELHALRDRGSTASFECRLPSSSGDVRWVRWSGARGDDGLVLSGCDVTSMREPERGRNELVASALDAIVSIDDQDRIVEFNPSAEEIFGYERERVLGRNLADLIVPAANRDAHRAGLARVAAGAPFRMLGRRLELSAMRADGVEVPIELSITQTSTDPFRVTAFVRDLSAQQSARDALKESETRYATAFDQAPIGIALVSIDPATPGRLTRVNGSLCQMLGRSEEELLAGTFADFTHPDDVTANQILFAEVLARKRSSYEIEKRFLRSDGSVMWASVHGTVAQDEEGNPLYGIGQVQDITERKQAEEALRRNERRLARTERLARIGAWEWDIVSDEFSWSRGLDDLFGVQHPDWKASQADFLSIVHPADRARVRKITADAFDGGVAKSWEYRVVRGEETFHIYSWGDVVLTDGVPTGLSGYAQDVTGRRLAEAKAEDLRRDNELILEAAGEGIFRVDGRGFATYVNPTAARLLGYAPSELVGKRIHDLVHHSDRDGTPHSWRDCPARVAGVTGETGRVINDVLWRSDGTPLAVDFTSAPVQDGDELNGAVIVFNDVTERRELEDRLRTFAEIDPLTGLMNRRRFEETLAERLGDRRGGGGSLLLLDLDHFKFVNDSFGHAAGDALIQAIARILRSQVRDDDVLARLGGDEFAVLLPGADTETTRMTARRLLAAVEEARPTGLQVGASIGATSFEPNAGTTAGDLLVSADIALYEAKGEGRGRVEFFTGQPGRSLTWVQRIRSALSDGRFVLHAQPIIDLSTGEAVHEELLVRMLDETGGVIPPAHFLPTAEAFGLIGDIDRWVVKEAVGIAATGRCVHVNLSGRSASSQVLRDELTVAIRTSGVDPRNLVFELTETAAVSNMTDARDFAIHLRELGCRMALDDFGTGFGSLTYLRNLPADFLKIDMDFVRNLSTSEADLRVVEAVVDIAARFGQRTVAEGVEDEQALALLRRAGVDFAQGYLLGRPAPLESAKPEPV